MIDWQALIQTLGTATISVAALAWVARSIAGLWFSRSIERYKSDLGREAQQELESLKHSFQIRASEQSTTFSQLHAKRGTVIAALYEFLVVAEEAVDVFIDPRRSSADQGAKEIYDQAFSALRDLYQFFRRNRIYLSPELCNRIEKLFKSMHESAWSISYFVVFAETNREPSADELKTRREQWLRFRGEVAPVMLEVEAEFRRILGVQSLESEAPTEKVVPPSLQSLDPSAMAKRLAKGSE